MRGLEVLKVDSLAQLAADTIISPKFSQYLLTVRAQAEASMLA